LAYMIGADLAATSMCRAATEILLRFHYNGGDTKSDLIPLIKQTERKREFSFLRAYNLVAKVDEANGVLHFRRNEIANNSRSRSLIGEWVRDLQQIIQRAPTRR
jgi:hypothetical protein